MVPSSRVTAVGGEESAVVFTLEGHTEVIALRVERKARVGKLLPPILSCVDKEDVVSSQPRMPVAGEIEITIRPESREGFIALGVDGASYVLYAPKACRRDTYPPNIEATDATGHIRCEIEPLTVRREGRVGVAGQGVAGELHGRGLAPGSIAAGGFYNLGIAG